MNIGQKKSKVIYSIIFKTILILSLLFSVSNGAAANFYINRTSGNSPGSGSDWTNARTNLPTTYTRSDTYYVADGAYGTVPTLDTAPSGTSYITIKKATVADHGTSTGWSDSMGDGQATFTSGSVTISSSYWRFDGATRSSYTNGHGFSMVGPSPIGAGFFIDNATNVIIANVAMTGHINALPKGDDNAVWIAAGYSPSLTVSNCYFKDWGRCMFKTHTTGIYNSVIANNWFEGNRSDGTVDADGEFHSEGVFSWSSYSNVWAYNIWVDIEGTGVIMLGNGGYNEIYGNLFFWTTNYPCATCDGGFISNGTIGNWTGYTSSTNKIYNNTCMVPPSGGIEFGFKSPDGNGSMSLVNNLFACTASRNVYGTSTTRTNNAYWNLTRDNGVGDQTFSSNPFVDSTNYNFSLKAHTTAGTDLGGAPYNVDLNGNTRTTWDRGFLEYFVASTYPGIQTNSFVRGQTVIKNDRFIKFQ